MNKKKRKLNNKKPKRKKKATPEINIEQILLKNRRVFLYDTINSKNTLTLIKHLISLDLLNNKPILMTINSPGGSITDGLAIIDSMKGIKSKIITLVSGEACSMASLISVCGDHRVMTDTSIWMMHPPKGGVSGDYFSFERDRIRLLDLIEEIGDNIYKKHTKLTKKEITKGKTGELWLTAKQCKQKGIIETVI